MSKYPVNLYRTSIGRATSAAQAAQYSICSFYNAGSGIYWLLVWDFVALPTTLGICNVGLNPGAPAGATQPFQSCVPTEGSPSAVSQATTNATAPNISYFVGSAGTAYYGWYRDFPFVAIPPNWSLQIFPAVVNVGMTASVMVEEVTAEELVKLRFMPEGDTFPTDINTPA